ncbi:FecR domain-containing protein [Echinicola marina]|uniref:FecR family protein n=1 Tax=Echinicola marina TaxID=2859768 RepID=UPI001CF695E6|nr:FecR family protein [Echinicola marina]UCS94998.1 FecR domain-containing protein [Echinicola marina]
MSNEENHIDKLLADWLAGNAKEKDKEAIKQWAAESEENLALLENLKDVWSEKSPEPILVNAEEKIHEMWEAGMQETESNKTLWKAVWRYAAAILLLISVSGSLYFYMESSDPEPTVVAHSNYVIRENPSGQKTKLFLPDGSVAYLNSSSRIKFIQGFSGNERRILLSGEAYFEVAKNKEKPFVVESQGLETVALGTAFNVNAYPGQDELSVSLVEGKVEIRQLGNQGDRLILSPGREASLIQSTNEVLERSFDPMAIIGWKDGKLVFSNAAFDQVKIKLERWFGVKIEVRGDIPQDWHVSTIYEGQNLKNILTDLQYAKNFAYEIKGDNITIRF